MQLGSGDLCFITEHPVDDVLRCWLGAGIEVLFHPLLCEMGEYVWRTLLIHHLLSTQVLEGSKVVDRTGAVGKLRSVYCRDPDGNLIE